MVTDLRSFYERCGEDYDSFLARLMGRETLVRKYLNLFIADTTYLELKSAVQEKDNDVILVKAHTLKGLALNVNFTRLGTVAADMVDSLRLGKTDSLDEQFIKVQQEYEEIMKELEA